MRKIIYLFYTSIACISVFSQTGIGTATPDPSAVLDVNATDKGILANKVDLQSTTDVTTIPNPAAGLLVYTTQDHNPDDPTGIVGDAFYYFDGSSWEKIYTPGELIIQIERLRVPIFAASVFSKADFILNSTNFNDVTYVPSTTDEFYNSEVLLKESNTTFKAKKKGVYMIDGFVNLIQTLAPSESSSWTIKIVKSTDNGVTWTNNYSKGNRCNHTAVWGNVFPETCLLQDSFLLEPDDLIKFVIFLDNGSEPLAPHLKANSSPLRYSSGFKIICYPIL